MGHQRPNLNHLLKDLNIGHGIEEFIPNTFLKLRLTHLWKYNFTGFDYSIHLSWLHEASQFNALWKGLIALRFAIPISEHLHELLIIKVGFF